METIVSEVDYTPSDNLFRKRIMLVYRIDTSPNKFLCEITCTNKSYVNHIFNIFGAVQRRPRFVCGLIGIEEMKITQNA